MKLLAEIIKPQYFHPGDPTKIFHVRLALGVRRFLREDIVRRHIGPRPWSEMTYVDDQGHVHEVFAK